MEAAKNIAKKMTSSDSQFKTGHQPPIQHQSPPGLESAMNPQPVYNQLPTPDGGYQLYKPAGKLLGKKALITGGDSGIGRSVAVLYAMEGADSAIVYLPGEESDAQETKRLVEVYGRKCVLFPTDLTVAENCKRVVAQTVEALGGINILVNNAGTQLAQESIADISDEQWDFTFKSNIYSMFYLSKYSLPHLSSGDTIINNGSINHYIGKPNLLDYTSTKGAIIAFTRSLSNQLCGKGIRVNAVAPGPIWTPLVVATMTSEDLDGFHSTPMGRAGQPSEVATCFVFLASADSSFISGQTLHPNGGSVING
ncbi:hypothetical protein DFP73DRAFT_492652 [Morchella snyderi]|nr:hypothetical protein DFP73DRAFT_492652 [Morchella snyderi]